MAEDLESKKNLPGGPLKQKPLEINGVFYDPLHPPKLYRTPDGKEEYRGGKTLSKDDVYSALFWAKSRPNGLRETMIEIIESSAKTGEFNHFAGFVQAQEGKLALDQDSKEQLSAYRVLAKELGFQIGDYKLDKHSDVASASIGRGELVDQKKEE